MSENISKEVTSQVWEEGGDLEQLNPSCDKQISDPLSVHCLPWLAHFLFNTRPNLIMELDHWQRLSEIDGSYVGPIFAGFYWSDLHVTVYNQDTFF